MPDVGHPTPDGRAMDGIPVAAALRALPLEAPPRSAWPALAATLATGAAPRAPRWPYAMATAAALALAFVLPVPGGRGDAPTTDDVAAMAPAATDLPALMRESARLERLIAAVDAEALQPADALVLGLAFESELTAIDHQLALARPGSRDAERLWQQRIDVLSRYAELQSSRRLLASAGQPFETTLVSLY